MDIDFYIEKVLQRKKPEIMFFANNIINKNYSEILKFFNKTNMESGFDSLWKYIMKEARAELRYKRSDIVEYSNKDIENIEQELEYFICAILEEWLEKQKRLFKCRR